ncbi:MAG: hypothetical protein HKN68_19400 [Saprospiraceae bacterium]|nr:hypothetical protein [Saprospiraceae bacterium]
MIKGALIAFSLIFLITAVLIFRPVPIVAEFEALTESGIVTDIYEAGVNDIVFLLKDNGRRFYINRGLENGLELNSLKEKLIGNKVVFKYPKYWTPLDWNDEIKHLSKVEFKDEVIFNELK